MFICNKTKQKVSVIIQCCFVHQKMAIKIQIKNINKHTKIVPSLPKNYSITIG